MAPAPSTHRAAQFQEVLALHAQGWSCRRIALTLHLHWRTVKRYLEARELPKRGAPCGPQPSSVAPHWAYLQQRWQDGCHNGSQLWRELREQGYAGSLASVHRALKHLRPGDGRQPDATPTAVGARRTLSPRRAMWLLVRAEVDLRVEERAARAAVLLAEPTLVVACALTRQFLTLLRERNEDALDAWFTAVTASGIKEFLHFAASLRRDEAAVRAALREPWSNGQLEGQINRVKVIKRVVYGRAKFDLLRRRILCVA